MSLTDSEIMGGVGFGDDEFAFHNYAENISDLIEGGRKKTDSFDLMMGGEELSYVKGNPRIENSQYTYTNRSGFKGKSEPYGRMVPEDLDNGSTVQRYLLERLPAQNVPIPAKFRPSPNDPRPFEFGSRRYNRIPALEKFEERVQETLGENTISLLFTIIFILLIALVSLQIMNARRLHKMVKSILKNIPHPVYVSHVEKGNTD